MLCNFSLHGHRNEFGSIILSMGGKFCECVFNCVVLFLMWLIICIFLIQSVCKAYISYTRLYRINPIYYLWKLLKGNFQYVISFLTDLNFGINTNLCNKNTAAQKNLDVSLIIGGNC